MDFAREPHPLEQRNNEQENQQIRTDPSNTCQESSGKSSRNLRSFEKGRG